MTNYYDVVIVGMICGVVIFVVIYRNWGKP